ncbi:MAG: glutathione S-transferase [Hyphomicrobiaceae bacterium]
MSKLKLAYFDIDGARGEAARLAMVIGGVPFEDDRVKFTDWESRKPGTPFGALPVLEMDGQTVAQSNAINRYVGKLAGLYPSDAWQAALCDEVMDAVEEIATKVWATMFLPAAEKKSQRESLAAGPLSSSLDHLQRRLLAHGGHYFADSRLTVADLKVFVWIRHVRSGQLDHVAVDLPDRVAPRLVEHYDRVKQHPAVKAYYAKRKVAI